MLPAQVSLSFAVWIVAGVLVGRRALRLGPPRYGRSAAMWLGALLFMLSALVLLGGLAWIAKDGGRIKDGFSPATWLAITGLGGLFTVGQAEAAGLVIRSIAKQEPVTTSGVDPSSSSDPISAD